MQRGQHDAKIRESTGRAYTKRGQHFIRVTIGPGKGQAKHAPDLSQAVWMREALSMGKDSARHRGDPMSPADQASPPTPGVSPELKLKNPSQPLAGASVMRHDVTS